VTVRQLAAVQPTAAALAAGLAMPVRDWHETFHVWHVEALRAAVTASGVVLPSSRSFHAATIGEELSRCMTGIGDDDGSIDRTLCRRIGATMLAELLLAVPLEVRALVQLDVLEAIGMAIVEGKTGLVLVERAGVAPSGSLMAARRAGLFNSMTLTDHN